MRFLGRLSTLRRDPAFLYGVLSFCKLSIHNVFLVHHCDVFLRYYQIDKGWFYWGQVIFMIWNAINDPLFGYISDRQGLLPGDKSVSRRKRTKTLAWAGILMCISFCFFWLDLFYPGPRFVFALCLYDTFLTIVDLHLAAILVEFAVASRDRARFSLYSSLFSMASAMSVGISHVLHPISPEIPSESRESERNLGSSLEAFRLFCVVLSVLCAISLVIVVRAFHSISDKFSFSEKRISRASPPPPNDKPHPPPVCKVLISLRK
ncbi:hypothetical protein AAMO2058_001578300 [Amorphochlora amoebiformis]